MAIIEHTHCASADEIQIFVEDHPTLNLADVWANAKQNQQNNQCAQRGLRANWTDTDAQSDMSLLCANSENMSA